MVSTHWDMDNILIAADGSNGSLQFSVVERIFFSDVERIFFSDKCRDIVENIILVGIRCDSAPGDEQHQCECQDSLEGMYRHVIPQNVIFFI